MIADQLGRRRMPGPGTPAAPVCEACIAWGTGGTRTIALGIPRMRAAIGCGRIAAMIETATSVTVIHGAMLSFEAVEAPGADHAPVRLREHHETLLRVIEGTITLELDGHEHTLMLEGEARIGSGVPHRVWNAGAGEARIVQEFRRTDEQRRLRAGAEALASALPPSGAHA